MFYVHILVKGYYRGSQEELSQQAAVQTATYWKSKPHVHVEVSTSSKEPR